MVTFRNVFNSLENLNKCKDYVESKSDLLFIETWLQFSSI